MKTIFTVFFIVAATIVCRAQQDTSKNNAAQKYMDAAQKMYASKNYAAALENVNNALKSSSTEDDYMLYFKIQVLQNMYTQGKDLTDELDRTISSFFKKVNKFSFPEDEYAEVARTNVMLQQFKQKDKAFADSVAINLDFKDLQTSQAISGRIAAYLKATPNTYYKQDLTDAQNKAKNDIDNVIAHNKKVVADSVHKADLKQAGKRTGVYFSYAIPDNTIKQVHESFASGEDAKNFFSQTGTVALGARFAAGISIGDIIIPAYTSPSFRLSIDWNFLDGEYYQFDWSADSIVDVQKLHTIKAGTRIGPSASFYIGKKISAAVYFSFRPGIQFTVGKLDFMDYKGDTDPESISYLKPSIGNFNLSSEIGAKLRISFFCINPFYHFGTFNWKSSFYNGNEQKIGEAQCGYKYSYLGVRIGL